MRFSAALLAVFLLGCSRATLKVEISKANLLANGYDSAQIRISGVNLPPRLQILGDSYYARIAQPRSSHGIWTGTVQTGVLPGTLRLHITSGKLHADRTIELTPQITDSASDGTPDFLRLESDADRAAFRFWLTYLAEIQFFLPESLRSPEIIDCSALVRYAYREALRNHDAAWFAATRIPMMRAYPSIQKYSFPRTLLGPRIFRTVSGTYAPADLANPAFSEFADAKTLRQYNTFFVSRDVNRASPGDVLFYRRETPHGVTYHSMVFLGKSTVQPDDSIYVVYHTGSDSADSGEIRRLTLTELLHFPNPQWHPIAANPLFLGVFRWNILKVIS